MYRLWPILLLLATGIAWARPQLGAAPAGAKPEAMRVHRDLQGYLTQLKRVPAGSGTALVWRNPRSSDPGVLSRNGVAEGLHLVGKGPVDPTKGVAIYIHGWTPTGDYVPQFENAAEWQRRGWNTFAFLWHKRSYGDVFQADKMARSGEVTQDLVRQLAELRRLLDRGEPGSYAGEIRLIGYSMGAYVALQAARQSFYENDPYAMLDFLNRRLRRVDLLEPAFLDDFMRADQVFVGGYHHTRIMTTAEISKDTVGTPRDLNSWGVKMVAFTSAVYRNIAPDLEKTMPTQKLNEKWEPARGKVADIEGQHTSILRYYFQSIAQQAPPVLNKGKRALSAATPTAELRQGPTVGSLIQVKGTKTLSMADDAYFEEQVDTTRGGVLVDQDPFYQDEIRGGNNAGLVVPVIQITP